MPQLADTVFATSAEDSLAAIDVYGESTASTQSGLTNTTGDSADLTSFLGKDAESAPSEDELDQALTATAIRNEMIDSDPALRSAYSDLDPTLQDYLTTPSGVEQIAVSDANAEALMPPQVVSAASSKNVSALIRVTAAITGGSNGLKSISVAASSAFLSNLVSVSVRNGIPNVYAKIDGAGYGTSIMAKVTNNCLSLAVKTGNLNLMTNLANGSMSGSIKGMFPGFPAAFAAGFKLDKNGSPKLYGQISTQIATSFGKIDANWSKGRNGTTFNGSLFMNASKDFKAVVSARVGSGRGFNSGYTTSASVRAALPGTALLNLGVQGKKVMVSGAAQMVYSWPSGRQDTYVPAEDGTYNVNSTLPTPFSNTSTIEEYNAANTSAIDDPMVLGGLITRAGDAYPSYDEDATAQMAGDFPYASMGDVAEVYA